MSAEFHPGEIEVQECAGVRSTAERAGNSFLGMELVPCSASITPYLDEEYCTRGLTPWGHIVLQVPSRCAQWCLLGTRPVGKFVRVEIRGDRINALDRRITQCGAGVK